MRDRGTPLAVRVALAADISAVPIEAHPDHFPRGITGAIGARTSRP